MSEATPGTGTPIAEDDEKPEPCHCHCHGGDAGDYCPCGAPIGPLEHEEE